MIRSSSRRRRTGAFAAAVAAAVAATMAPTAAQEEPPPPPPVFEGGFDLTPQPGFEEYEGCPLVNTGQFRFCIAITINGDLQLGDVGGSIDDLTMVLGAGGGISGDPVLVPAQGGGGPSDVPVPGGILGIPELDALLELDVLQLLTLSATPQLGELTQTGLTDVITMGVLGFLSYPALGPDGQPDPIEAGEEPAPLPAAGDPFCVEFFGVPQCVSTYPAIGVQLPLTLRLNNTLLGERCSIGPIDVDMTSGTTTPPEGYEPMTGSSGALARNVFPAVNFHIDGMRLVGNNFAVPGSDCSGIADAGDLTDSLGLGNPFEQLIDQQAGLPSGAGRNVADLTVDLHVANQSYVYGPPVSISPADHDFGDVAVGSTSAPQVFTVTNVRNSPRVVTARALASFGSYQTVDNQCGTGITGEAPGTLLGPGESCTITVVFAPTEAGTRTGTVETRARAGDGSVALDGELDATFTGRGV